MKLYAVHVHYSFNFDSSSDVMAVFDNQTEAELYARALKAVDDYYCDFEVTELELNVLSKYYSGREYSVEKLREIMNRMKERG